MSKALLTLHVLAVILTVGPVTVAGSMFPAAARRAAGHNRHESVATMRLLHRICRVYAIVGMAVPVFGLATASSMHVLGRPWLLISIVLTSVAAFVLALLVLPAQETAVAGLSSSRADDATAATRLEPAQIRRLAVLTGTFNLLWVAVTILMIVRPGSTTGA